MNHPCPLVADDPDRPLRLYRVDMSDHPDHSIRVVKLPKNLERSTYRGTLRTLKALTDDEGAQIDTSQLPMHDLRRVDED